MVFTWGDTDSSKEIWETEVTVGTLASKEQPKNTHRKRSPDRHQRTESHHCKSQEAKKFGEFKRTTVLQQQVVVSNTRSCLIPDQGPPQFPEPPHY